MSDILESNAVISVKKIFNQFAKFYGFEFLPKMLQVVYQSEKQIMPVQHIMA